MPDVVNIADRADYYWVVHPREGQRTMHSIIYGWACINVHYVQTDILHSPYLPKYCIDLENPENFSDFFQAIDQKILHFKS